MKWSRQHRRFTEEEDAQLRELVGQFGMEWAAIARSMPGRNIRQLRDRWTSYLADGIKHGQWTAEEDDLLRALVDAHGHKWRRISVDFPGRTDIDVKTRWTIISRRQTRENGAARMHDWAKDHGGQTPAPGLTLCATVADRSAGRGELAMWQATGEVFMGVFACAQWF